LNLIVELVDPAKFVEDHTLNTFECHTTERLGLSPPPKFRKLGGAGLQERLAEPEDGSPRLLWKGVKEGYPKKKGTIVSGVVFAKCSNLFEQIFPPGGGNPVLLSRLSPIARSFALFNPSVLREFLEHGYTTLG
jgi:hypothetical protein